MSNIAKEQFKLISKTSHISKQQEKAQDSNNTYSICLGTFGLCPLYKLGIYCIGKYNLFRFFFYFDSKKFPMITCLPHPMKTVWRSRNDNHIKWVVLQLWVDLKLYFEKYSCVFLENLLLLDKIEQIRLWSKTFRRLKKLTRFIVL